MNTNTNRPSNEEILQALRTLRDLCDNFSSCASCPCCVDGHCEIQNNTPARYELNEPEEKWCAFRE